MEGLTTALVGFILVCVAFPHLIKRRDLFYIATGITLVALLVQAVGVVAGPGRLLASITLTLSGIMRIAAVALLIMAAGGLSPQQLAEDVNRSFKGDDDDDRPAPSQRPTAQPPTPGTPPQGSPPTQPARPQDSGPLPLD